MQIKVPGMSCNHCVKRITAALEPLEGVDSLSVNLDKKTVEVTGSIDIESVKKAVEGAGYTVE